VNVLVRILPSEKMPKSLQKRRSRWAQLLGPGSGFSGLWGGKAYKRRGRTLKKGPALKGLWGKGSRIEHARSERESSLRGEPRASGRPIRVWRQGPTRGPGSVLSRSTHEMNRTGI